MEKSLCIVASTLPIAFLAEKASLLKIGEVIAMSDDLAHSYSHLNSHSDLQLKIKTAPKGLLFQSIYFLIKIFLAKLRGQEVIFFHECCMPVFDLILTFLNPNGHYYPQVSMSGSKLIDYAELPRSKIFNFISHIGLKNHFDAYYSPGVGGSKPEYHVSVKKYPNGIEEHPIGYLMRNRNGATATERSILFVVGKSRVPDEDQIDLYDRIIKIALDNRYRCYIKDHPNQKFQLGYINDLSIILNSSLPSELINDNYQWVIGTSSTSLLNHGKRAISLIGMLQSFKAADQALIKSHFRETDPNHKINFVDNDEQLFNLLKG
ncbi:polysialyltransferase family glycosyltransferase [Lentilitoribacter sp. EG35]|uniref:polysialyltransferase family glycosyltransferase n=1 Tax=Lentilitoribacter sp. EG35 TaxID=3234192 RepID=UPI003460CC9F